MALSFTVFGHPEPAGSKRAFVNPKTKRAIVTDANAKAKPWKQAVIAAVVEQHLRAPIEGPLELSVTFYLRRPKSHYRTGSNSHLLRDSAPTRPIGRPDSTKLVRPVEDALTDVGAWHDDAQVVDQYVGKVYGLPERCEVQIYPAPLHWEAAA